MEGVVCYSFSLFFWVITQKKYFCFLFTNTKSKMKNWVLLLGVVGLVAGFEAKTNGWVRKEGSPPKVFYFYFHFQFFLVSLVLTFFFK